MSDRFDQITALPQAVRDHLYSAELANWYTGARAQWNLSEQQLEAIDDAVLDVYVRVSTIDQLRERVAEVVGDAKRAAVIVIEILGHDLIFIENYLGVNIAEYIRTLGGDPVLYVHVADPEEVAEEIIQKDGVTPPTDPIVRHRLMLAIVSFLTDARTRQQTLDVIARGMKIGGVGLTGDEAERLCVVVEAKKTEFRTAGVIFKKDGAVPSAESSFHLMKPAESGAVQLEDEAEIARIRQGMPAGDHKTETKEAAERVIARVGAKFKHEEAAKRFRLAIESRLRDIRDRQETFDLLTRPTTVGGLGIPADRVEKVLAVVEEEFTKLHPTSKKPTADSRKPIAPVIASAPKANVVISDERRGGPSHSTGVPVTSPPAGGHGRPPLQPSTSNVPAILPSPPPAAIRPIIALPPPPPVAELVHPVPPKAKNNELGIKNKGIEPPKSFASSVRVPPSQPIAPASVAEASSPRRMTGVRPPSDRGDLKVAATLTFPPAPKPVVAAPGFVKPEPAPPPPIPRSPVAPTPPSVSSSGRPKLQDVRSVPPRLIGPIEELGRLTLDDFRKIAKAPGDAAARVLDKIALLQKDSYTKRAEGIRAFRESPLILLYADVVNAALFGKKPVEAVVRERGVGDRNSITIEELGALQTINAQLRF